MISLLIPTLNRSQLLIKLLGYYAEVGFQGTICIGDSSDDEHVRRTKEAIKTFQSKLDIIYREYPLLHDAACVQKLLDLVTTPYAAYIADDDFFVPSALDQCASFLENQPEYSAAHGLGALLVVQKNGGVRNAGHYKQQVTEADTASQRLIDHLANYSATVFSLHRTESLRAMYQRVHTIPDRGFAGEMLPTCMTVVLGRVKYLDCFYLVRLAHDQRHFLPGQFDWITKPQWVPSYEIFLDQVGEELARRDGMSKPEGMEVVKQAFSGFLIKGMVHQWNQRYLSAGAQPRSRWREMARRAPVLRRVWQQGRSYLPNEDHRLSLPALLRPTSRYHADFMPVYRAVTASP